MNFIKYFVLLTLAITVNIEASDTPITRVTKTGAVFTRVERAGFGEAWSDPSGQIWGDAVKDQKGILLSLVWQEAISYCNEIGGEFPSKEDFLRLRQYMGGSIESNSGFTPQVLPNLNGYSFWSQAYGGDLAYAFSGSDGRITDYDISYNYPMNFRCVTR